MKNDVFIYTEQFKELFLKDILLSYIYPRVFICEDDFECKYLFYEMESEDNYIKWLVTVLKKKDYLDLLDKKKPIQSIYRNASTHNLFSITKTYHDEKDTVGISFDEGMSLLDLLPAEDVYSEK